MHIATKHSDIRIITLLLKYNADIHLKNLLNKTPYNIAMKSDDDDIKFLFSNEFFRLLGMYVCE